MIPERPAPLAAGDAGVVCTRKPHLSRPARKRGGADPRSRQPPGMPAHPSGTQPAPRAARRRQLADPRDHAHALVAGLVQGAPAR